MIFDLFSYRNRDNKEEPDVYVYDKFPKEFRNQFLYITFNVCEVLINSFPNPISSVLLIYSREAGMKHIFLQKRDDNNTWRAFEEYVSACTDIEFLDIMDLTFRVLVDNDEIRNYSNIRNSVFIDAIEELNERLKRHNLGYEFSNGMIIKKTNKVTHETIIKPALKLLCDEGFKGAEDEYLNAWKQFMDGNNQGAILNAAKAFESFMKIICSKMHYTFDKEKDTAKKLLEHLKNNNFFPSYLENHLNALITTLESGAPTVRNKTAGHGQGEECISVPDDYATYVLNLVASNIVFLHSIYKEHHSG